VCILVIHDLKWFEGTVSTDEQRTNPYGRTAGGFIFPDIYPSLAVGRCDVPFQANLTIHSQRPLLRMFYRILYKLNELP
jgi:hypothetical protein